MKRSVAASYVTAVSRRNGLAMPSKSGLQQCEDECRTRKDHAPTNLATMRHATLNLLTRENSKISIKRKRLKAAINPEFRTALLTRLLFMISPWERP